MDPLLAATAVPGLLPPLPWVIGGWRLGRATLVSADGLPPRDAQSHPKVTALGTMLPTAVRLPSQSPR
jgi:hypothetical protein